MGSHRQQKQQCGVAAGPRLMSSVRHQLSFGLRQKQSQDNESKEAHARRHEHGGSQALIVDHGGVDLQTHKDKSAEGGHAQGGANGANLQLARNKLYDR